MPEALPGFQGYVTPSAFFDPINAAHRFTIDGAADPASARVPLWYGPNGVVEDAFEANPRGERIWLNPPYRNMEPWMFLAKRWSLAGNTVVLLCQDKTDTGWWHELFAISRKVVVPKGRIPFEVPPGTVHNGELIKTSTNMHGATLFSLHRYALVNEKREPAVFLWDWKKEPYPVL